MLALRPMSGVAIVASLNHSTRRKMLPASKSKLPTLTLSANVAKAAIDEASLRTQIAATHKLIDLQQERLTLLQRQHIVGAISEIDLLSQETALAQTRQTLPLLETQLAQQRNLLTALAGRYPSDEVAETFELSGISLPARSPTEPPVAGCKSAAGHQGGGGPIHAAGAKIGVALAARLPNISLTGNGGSGAFQFGQLFTPGTNYYSLVGNVTQPFFDGMTLLNRQKAAEAGFVQAEAQYRATVINAFQNVADVLRALQGDARAVREARAAEAAAHKYLTKVRSQLALGAVSQLAVVDAQRAYITTAISRIQADAQRLTNSVALFVALGGGTW